ncbi:DUF2207 domain-containing protein [Pararhizobium sp.]|uniref:DUF2207 domain-containing protein n=1 Tax=Pararhizobium sp. TaxID=1977563 RepID=UPI0027182E11|nr:DUF2207 domain-containing protein [Pararhizobium sp.]MDO9415692.1 DUF2207 domain-containing protein [Pararhizobium sp.]
MTRFLAALLFALALLPPAFSVRAEEHISFYQSDIAVAKTGTVTVTETITAVGEGDKIRRGIYRDMPLTQKDADGNTIRVDFKILSVERDGESEPYHTENISGGIRIYIGDADTLLSLGPHTFTIAYETGRQIRFFDSHDELYWNAIGTEWAFPIREGLAKVTLPPGVEPQDTAVFTGALGSTDRDARVTRESGQVVFSTTQGLRPGEGLTIAIKMPKGSIDPPSALDQRAWWLRDHLPMLLAGAGLIVVLAYYSFAWNRVGRDPERGVLVPRWDAPDNISPALVNYIDNKGFSDGGWTALSAAALSLAVSGHVVLDDLKSAIVIRSTGKAADASMPTGERNLLDAVTSRDGTLTIDKENGPAVQTVGNAFRSAMEKEHRNKYYHANKTYIFLGLALSALSIVSIFVFGDPDEATAGLILVPVFISFVLGTSMIGIGSSMLRARSLVARIAAVILMAFFSFVALILLAGLALVAYQTMDLAIELPLMAAIGGIILTNAVFYFLMGAPTPIGTKMMDGIDGLRQYMMLAERDRMNMAGAPQMSPQHFEKLLPYAVALGVEKPWSKTFQTWLAAATASAAASAAYLPAWYSGDGLSAGSFGDRMGNFSSSMSSTMASSLPPPPSSDSSGFSSSSGSSGGGGGGGGGGGW